MGGGGGSGGEATGTNKGTIKIENEKKIKRVPSVAQFLQIYYTIINVMCYIGSVEIHIRKY